MVNTALVNNKELHELTVTEAASLIAQKKLSPVELTTNLLDRMETIGQDLHAFVSIHRESSLEVAKAAESLITAGYQMGPLHGVPIAIKDNIGLAGRATSAGSKILKDNIPTEDSQVVNRLKSAGANLVANTNMHEFAWGATSENPHYGTVLNPWDKKRIASGSSGGSGAAVAARVIPAALGTDTGGSIRLPSSANGIVGIRPTIGRVSNRGIIPLAWSMDTCGPMTRSVEDCALLLQVIAGDDPKDPSTAQVQVDDYLLNLRLGAKGMKVGVIPEHFFQQVQPAVLDALKESLKVFESLGAEIVECSIQDLEMNISALMTIESAEPSAYHQRWMRERPQDYGENVRFMFEQGELYTASHYIQAQRFRRILRDRFIDKMANDVDFFALPTLPFTAPIIGTSEIELEPGVIRPTLEAIMRFTGIASVTGLPGISVPAGFDKDNLPIGLQLLGRPFDETTLFRAAYAFEQATDFHLKSPAI